MCGCHQTFGNHGIITVLCVFCNETGSADTFQATFNLTTNWRTNISKVFYFRNTEQTAAVTLFLSCLFFLALWRTRDAPPHKLPSLLSRGGC